MIRSVKTYIITYDQELTVVENRTGTRQVGFFVPKVNLFAQNNETPAIYMASADGAILALKPARASIPGIPPPISSAETTEAVTAEASSEPGTGAAEAMGEETLRPTP